MLISFPKPNKHSGLCNAALVKNASGKWMMFVNYVYLNRACPKDSYMLLNIVKLVDNSVGVSITFIYRSIFGV